MSADGKSLDQFHFEAVCHLYLHVSILMVRSNSFLYSMWVGSSDLPIYLLILFLIFLCNKEIKSLITWWMSFILWLQIADDLTSTLPHLVGIDHDWFLLPLPHVPQILSILVLCWSTWKNNSWYLLIIGHQSSHHWLILTYILLLWISWWFQSWNHVHWFYMLGQAHQSIPVNISLSTPSYMLIAANMVSFALISVGPGQLIVDILLAFLVCYNEVKGSGLDVGQNRSLWYWGQVL